MKSTFVNLMTSSNKDWKDLMEVVPKPLLFGVKEMVMPKMTWYLPRLNGENNCLWYGHSRYRGECLARCGNYFLYSCTKVPVAIVRGEELKGDGLVNNLEEIHFTDRMIDDHDGIKFVVTNYFYVGKAIGVPDSAPAPKISDTSKVDCFAYLEEALEQMAPVGSRKMKFVLKEADKVEEYEIDEDGMPIEAEPA